MAWTTPRAWAGSENRMRDILMGVDTSTLPSAVFVYDDGRRVDATVARGDDGRIRVHVPIHPDDVAKGHLETFWVSTAVDVTFSAQIEAIKPDDT